MSLRLVYILTTIACIVLMVAFPQIALARIGGKLQDLKHFATAQKLKKSAPFGLSFSAYLVKNGKIAKQTCGFVVSGIKGNWTKGNINRAANLLQTILQEALGPMYHITPAETYKLLSRYYPITFDDSGYSKPIYHRYGHIEIGLIYSGRIVDGEIHATISDSHYPSSLFDRTPDWTLGDFY